MTRCPMTVRLRCPLRSLLDKWRGSTNYSRYVVESSLQKVRSHGWMGKHVRRVVFGVGPASVIEMGWRSCVCIWYVLNLFYWKQFATQWFKTLVGESFWHILCLYVDCRGPTEFVQQDASHLTILGVWPCIKGFNNSVDSSFKLFHLILWRVSYGNVQCFWDLIAACFRLWNIREAFALYKSKQYLLCLMDLVFF